MWDAIKDYGWNVGAAVLLIVFGATRVANLGLHDFFEFDSAAWPAHVQLGLLCVALGLLFVLGSVLVPQKKIETLTQRLRSAETDVAAARQQSRLDLGGEVAALERRRRAFMDLSNLARGRRALSQADDETFVGRVHRSARTLRDEFYARTTGDAGDEFTHELAHQLAASAAAFMTRLEYVERRAHVNLEEQPDLRTGDLDDDCRRAYLSALGHWRTETEATRLGARLMLGLKDDGA